MKHISSFSILLVGLFLLNGLAHGAGWIKEFGGTGWEYGYAIATTQDGGLLIAGDTTSLGAGNTDFIVLKLDSNGNRVWEKTYGGIGQDEEPFALKSVPGAGFIVAGKTDSFGTGREDVWVLMLNEDGTPKWEKTYGGSWNDGAYGVALADQGGFVLAGSSASFGSMGFDGWLLKLDSTGAIKWQKAIGGTGNDYLFSLARGGGGYYAVGATASATNGGYDLWVVKLDEDGNLIWQKALGGDGNDFATSVSATDNGCIIAGVTSSSGAGLKDAWLIELTGDGDVEWQKTIGGTGDDIARAVQVTNSGYIFAGTSTSFGTGTEDVWLVSISKSGAIQWQRVYQGILHDGARDLILGEDDSIFVVGGTSSSGFGDFNILVMNLLDQGSIADSTFEQASSNASVHSSNINAVTPDIEIWDTSIEPQDSKAEITGDQSTSDMGQNVTLEVQVEDLDCGDGLNAGSVESTSPKTVECSNEGHCSFQYGQGEVIELRAVARSGYVFSGWADDGGACGSESTCTVVLDTDKSVRALFSRVLETPSSNPQYVELQPVSAPSCNNPIGVGRAANGDPIIDLQVKLLRFHSPVDVYLGIMAPAIDPNTIYLVTSSGIEPFVEDLRPWKVSINTELDERPFGEQHPPGHPELSGIQVPPGQYHFYLLVLPAGQDLSGGYVLYHTAVSVN